MDYIHSSFCVNKFNSQIKKFENPVQIILLNFVSLNIEFIPIIIKRNRRLRHQDQIANVNI